MAAIRSLDTAIVTNQKTPEDGGRILIRSRNIPRTSELRQRSSRDEQPIHIRDFLSGATDFPVSSKTFLYLAYGSNLCAETFLVKRNIKPLSQVNVVVPQLVLTFDLPGIPYKEPCFGNCRYRSPDAISSDPTRSNDYHKDRWHKGMVGVVYEVTAPDYAHIIATEGGGSGYQDVVVDCFPLSADPNEDVPSTPTTTPFKAHTLFCPPTARSRPDPSYAQPSARYKKLITDGAQEHALPHEYQDYLAGLRTYTITTMRQKMGRAMFLGIWGPIVGTFFMVFSKMLVRKDGTLPKWYIWLINSVFISLWASYDNVFKERFGDGERTIGDFPIQQREKQDVLSYEKADFLPRSAQYRDLDDASHVV